MHKQHTTPSVPITLSPADEDDFRVAHFPLIEAIFTTHTLEENFNSSGSPEEVGAPTNRILGEIVGVLLVAKILQRV